MKKPLSPDEIVKRKQLIIDDYDGILPYHEALYIQSIMYSAKSSNSAFTRFDSAISQDDFEQALLTIQEALTHAAAISRYFWPGREKPHHKVRGDRLRAAFAVDDQSPLRARELRNALEHFDERLDQFLVEDPTGIILPGPIVGDHTIADDPKGNVFRLVDPIAQVFVIFGEKYNFSMVRHEVIRVLTLATAFDQNGGRIPRRK